LKRFCGRNALTVRVASGRQLVFTTQCVVVTLALLGVAFVVVGAVALSFHGSIIRVVAARSPSLY
jgi:hypothetical protein